MTSVDSEKLALDVWLEVVDEVDTLDWWATTPCILEGCLVNAPLVELLELNIESGARVLLRNDTVDSTVGKASLVVEFFLACLCQLREDVASEGISSVDHVLASNDVEFLLVFTALVDTLCDDRSDESEDVGTDSASDKVCLGDLFHDVVLVSLGVDGAKVVDFDDLVAFVTHFDDGVGVATVELLDDLVDDINEDDLVTRVVEEFSCTEERDY